MAQGLFGLILTLLAAFGQVGEVEVWGVWLWDEAEIVIIQVSELEHIDVDLIVGDDWGGYFIVDGGNLSIRVGWQFFGVGFALEEGVPEILGTPALPGDTLYFAVIREGRVQKIRVKIDSSASVG